MDIVQMTKNIGKEIQKDARYTNYEAAKKASDEDTTLQDMVGKFNLTKMELQQEIQNPDKTQEKLQEIDGRLKELYATIMENPNMVAFNTAKQDMDDLIGYLQQIIVYSANGEDPDTVQPQSAGGCSGGSCSSCSGCK